MIASNAFSAITFRIIFDFMNTQYLVRGYYESSYRTSFLLPQLLVAYVDGQCTKTTRR